MVKPKLSLMMAVALVSATGFGTLAQVAIPLWLKPALLLLPLQIAAIAYVIWYWRDRPDPAPLAAPAPPSTNSLNSHKSRSLK